MVARLEGVRCRSPLGHVTAIHEVVRPGPWSGPGQIGYGLIAPCLDVVVDLKLRIVMRLSDISSGFAIRNVPPEVSCRADHECFPSLRHSLELQITVAVGALL